MEQLLNQTNTLDENRVREMFHLFSMVLPIGKENTKKLTDAFGEDIAKIIPDLLLTISNLCLRDKESFDGYLTFIEDGIAYMRCETDEKPEVDLDREEYETWMKAERIKQQRKQDRENKKYFKDLDPNGMTNEKVNWNEST